MRSDGSEPRFSRESDDNDETASFNYCGRSLIAIQCEQARELEREIRAVASKNRFWLEKRLETACLPKNCVFWETDLLNSTKYLSNSEYKKHKNWKI